MQRLFENWRKYINESAEPDHLSDEAELAVHPEADIGRSSRALARDDNQKLLDIFWGSGVQAAQLAELTGNTKMEKYFNDIIHMVKQYVSNIDGYINGTSRVHSEKPWRTQQHLETLANKIANQARQIKAHRRMRNIKFQTQQFRDWVDMLVEAGDYIWYHGQARARMMNVASSESSKSDYEQLKIWAGI